MPETEREGEGEMMNSHFPTRDGLIGMISLKWQSPRGASEEATAAAVIFAIDWGLCILLILMLVKVAVSRVARTIAN